MNKEELRIGNIILVDYDYYIVNSISATLCECLTMENNDPHQVHIGNIDPIPLSAAILEKAGFEYEDAGHNDSHVKGYWTKDDFGITEFTGDDFQFGYEVLNGWVEIDTVHKIQNCYYLIFNHELQITL